MRLSKWRKTAPTERAMDDRVLAVVGPVLVDLGAAPDPECWVAWGDDPDLRYSLLAPTLAGLVTVGIRLTTAEDGPRVIAKLIRWSKLSVSELGVEASGGHRIVAVQVENLVLKGMDEEADRICAFVRVLIAGIEDRVQVPIASSRTVAPILAVPAATALRASVRTALSAPVVAPRVARIVAAPRTAVPRIAAPAAVSAGGTQVAAKGGAEGAPAPKALKVVKPTAPRGTAPETKSAPAKAAPKGTVKSAAPTLVPPAPKVPGAPTGPVAPAEAALSPEQANAPTPIAARAAARHATAGVAPVVPTKPSDAEPETEPDRSGWVSPHPIEEQLARKPSKPRAWMP